MISYICTIISTCLLFVSAYLMVEIPNGVTSVLCFITMIIFMVSFGRMFVNRCNRKQNKATNDES